MTFIYNQKKLIIIIYKIIPMSSTPPPPSEEETTEEEEEEVTETTEEITFDQQLDLVVYDILRSDEFIDFIANLASTSIASAMQYADDDYYYYHEEEEDITWPTISTATLYVGDGEESEEDEEEIEWNISRYNGSEGQECSVCLIDFEKDDEVIHLACHHTFHQDCIMEWALHKQDCPNCREKIKN
jgi:hypothetical protein